MSRIFMDGFESGDFGLWTSVSGSVTISTYAGKTGNYCINFSSNISNIEFQLPVAKTELYVALKLIIGATPIATRRIIGFYNGTTCLGVIAGDSDFKIRAFNGSTAGTLLGISTKTASAWSLIEIRYIPHLTSGTFTVKINGITDIDISGIATAPSTSTITAIKLLPESTNLSGYIDDVIIDDANWIGPSSIQGLAVTGAGATTQFDPSTGSNYACIDEIPSSDADYISTNVANEIDTYACGDLTGTINSIKAVQVQARCMQEGSPAVPKIQLVTRPTSTDRVSASKDVQTFSPGVVNNIWELNPDDSAAWESADVNGMEIGVKAVAS